MRLSDAIFWVMIIIAVGITAERIYERVIVFLTEEVKEKKSKEEK